MVVMHTSNGAVDRRHLQRRVVRVLALGQVLGGLGVGASLALGALLVTDVSGSSAWSGMAATMNTLGAALLAVPLARLAQARGRRISLSTGALTAMAGAAVTIGAAVLGSFPLLLLGLALLGAGSALNLQSRFAATDLAQDDTRARDLSLVVWSTTIGAVLGPNLFEPGEVIGRALGLPELTGGFVIAFVAQAVGALVYLTALRSDPLLLAVADGESAGRGRPSPAGGLAVLRGSSRARRAVLTVALSHAVMVALMSMTPVHLTDHGASLSIVGLTISLHVAGMYAVAPVFGWLADRAGRRATILLGQAMLAASLVLSWLGSSSHALVTVSLVLLGLGWSASTVAGSALVAEAVAPPERPKLQGVSDLFMNLAGAIGGALAGPVLALVGFDGLSAALLVLVAVVVLSHRGGGQGDARADAPAAARGAGR
ncbi:MFS transporter [Kocuria dechangensis]|uniref:MFS transporter n=1 Tax=Kocuria dechangensis TaxID=1176249 RepID=A0A917LRN9_9MICC|nr:MFS transporter [Kocuria dechangensis]GGG53067.1 MFS transporter [Kocuria dechangensis]